jgi:hypothetical protein
MDWATFWAIFSQTHVVTLSPQGTPQVPTYEENECITIEFLRSYFFG